LCEYHKIPWHNTEECRSKKSLMAKMKVFELNFEVEKWIINVEPSPTVSTTKVWPSEPKEPKEGEYLFHSQMWVKGALLHFLVNSNSHKNLILVEVVKWIDLLMTLHLQPYTIGWLHQGRDLCVSQ
jgi:hypothetical protein